MRLPVAHVLWRVLLLAVCTLGAYRQALAVTPESPEVRELIRQGLDYLEKHGQEETRLGGKCLVALAFFKDGASPDHPRIQEAVAACEATTAAQIAGDSVYSNGLAIIFLAELDAKKYHNLISRFAGAMASRQKPHGGWGYASYSTGDTSQTQYAALSYWELVQAGLSPSVDSVDRCLMWLMKTQAPTGCWGYQGQIGELDGLVEQNKTSVSMYAAGMGSVLICGNMLGLIGPNASGKTGIQDDTAQEKLPEALRPADKKKEHVQRTLSGTSIQASDLMNTITRARSWMDNNFTIEWRGYFSYYLYSLERYKSFEELLTGDTPEEPEWYNLGYEYLKEHQKEHGGWDDQSGDQCATAFSILFLLRSTQKSIKASLGEGTLVGGRGLSANLANMKMRGGRLVAVVDENTEVDQLLELLEDSDSEKIEGLLNNPAALSVQDVGPEESRRLEQIVRSGGPEARLLAVRALARTRNLDYVPTLLYAMTDPDRRVVREARDGLRFISRRIDGFGLSDNYTDAQRYEALDHWKQWYMMLRPDAPPPL